MSTEDPIQNASSAKTDPLNMHEMLAHEQRCRRILDKRPEDDGARIDMAWCLLIQAVHRKGQESVIHKIAPLQSPEFVKLTGEAEQLTLRESRWLFAESLKHSYAVSKLSSNPRCLQEAERLTELIKISVGDDELSNVLEETSKAMTHLARAITHKQASRHVCSHRPMRRLPKF